MPNDKTETPPHQAANADGVSEFMELYTRHYPRLQYYVMALIPAPQDAADVLQEISIVLWTKFPQFESGTNFFAWACSIARFEALKHHEKKRYSAKKVEAGVLEKLAEDASKSVGPSDEVLDALQSCLAKLSDPDRELIRRRYEPNASVNAMAEEIGVSANLLSKSLGKIRRSLLICIQHRLAR